MSDPIVLSQLRHAYEQLVNGHVRDQRAFADGMIAPLIRRLEADPTTDEALVERVAADQADFDGRPWFAMPRADRERYIKRVHRFIRAMEEKP